MPHIRYIFDYVYSVYTYVCVYTIVYVIPARDASIYPTTYHPYFFRCSLHQQIVLLLCLCYCNVYNCAIVSSAAGNYLCNKNREQERKSGELWWMCILLCVVRSVNKIGYVLFWFEFRFELCNFLIKAAYQNIFNVWCRLLYLSKA